MNKQKLPLGLNLGLWDRMTSWREAVDIVRLAAKLGYADAVQAISAAYAEGGSAAATAATPDALAEAVSILGTIDECRTRVVELLDTGIHRLQVSLPAATRKDCEPILAGIMP